MNRLTVTLDDGDTFTYTVPLAVLAAAEDAGLSPERPIGYGLFVAHVLAARAGDADLAFDEWRWSVAEVKVDDAEVPPSGGTPPP